NDLFAHLGTLPLAFYQQRHTGDLMSRLVNDVTAVRMLLGPGILNFINTPVAYVYGLAFMLSYNVRLTLASLAVYPAALLVVKRTSRVLMERSLRVQEGLGELSNRVQENLSGMHVVKAYASEEHEVDTFARLNARFQELSLRLARVRGFIVPVMGTVAGELALRGVTFRYPGRPDRTPVLDDVDLTVPAGRTVAIVGRTGAGKSALVQLLPRLFDVEAGSILLDGRDIRTLPLGWLRRQ